MPSKLRSGFRSGVRRVADATAAAFVVCVWLVGSAASTHADSVATMRTRMALVVGNAAYTASPLNNPVRDAEAMARALGYAGFDVRLVRNATRVRLKTEIEAFGAEARAKAADVVFYFAGHAVQTAQENFLLPVDTDIRAATDVQFAAIELGLVLRTLRGRGEAVSVIILDACRAEAVPALAAQLKPGLAAVSAPINSYLAFATAPGRVAFDGRGTNSPYTAALVRAIAKPGATLEQVFRQVRRDVVAATGGRQLPWERSSLTVPYRFQEALPDQEDTRDGSGPTAVPIETLAEIASWKRIRSSRSVADYRGHIQRFPGGAFEELALSRIARLEAAQRAWSWWVVGPPSLIDTKATEAETAYVAGLAAEAKAADDPASFAVARSYYRTAAERGLASAAHALGRLLDRGLGGPEDDAGALALYRKAAAQGFGPALVALGTMREFGEGAPRDLAAALRAYKLGADAGNARAMTALGFLYATGKGVARDASAARGWYERAVSAGDIRAHYNLAVMLQSRHGGAPDAARAFALLSKAAARGHVRAKFAMAKALDRGTGVRTDRTSAAKAFVAAVRANGGSGRPLDAEAVGLQFTSLTWSGRLAVHTALRGAGVFDALSTGFYGPKTRAALAALGKAGPRRGRAIAER